MKTSGLFLVALLGAALIYCSMAFPPWGSPMSPASLHVSPHYIEYSMEETSVPNIVTSVLADYRGYDTLFETVVILTAGIACIFLLRTFRRVEPETRSYRHIPTGITLRISKGGRVLDGSEEFERIDSSWTPYDLILKTTCRLIIPFLQIFALYVIAHGHHSPGGGFQGGVILGASMILYAVAYDLRSAIKRMGERLAATLCVLGVFIYAGTGLFSVIRGKNFLDYSALAPIFGVDPIAARSLGILMVEIGVGIGVMAVMVSLYYNLSSAGKLDEGL